VAHGKTIVVCERGGVFFQPRHEGDTYNWAGIKSMAGSECDIIRGRITQSCCRIMRDGYGSAAPPSDADHGRPVPEDAGARRDG
jgi:hypothetical protein